MAACVGYAPPQEVTVLDVSRDLDEQGRVRAAGGVVVRDGTVLVVHRPRYDDWSLPKGKSEAGEIDEVTALREVREETGFECELQDELPSAAYVDSLGRPKFVRYWRMRSVGGEFAPGEEVDEVRWLGVEEARPLLTYEHDRAVLDGLARPEPPPEPLAVAPAPEPPVYFVRHAKAGDRAAWTEDDRLRPLSKKGRPQAEALVEMFRGEEIGRVISSPYVRCEQTVRPLALDRGLTLETDERLAEGAPFAGVLALLAESVGVATVLCGHGDLIPQTVAYLASTGVPVDDGASKKGSIWVLEREAGHVMGARYLPPPTD
jgi:phosphohistidine phosphatase SixA/ADP-ribose pyrophosphatase YjhB (NUDIX family)